MVLTLLPLGLRGVKLRYHACIPVSFPPKSSLCIQADSEGPPSEAGTMSRTGSSPIRAYRADDQPALMGSVRPPGRKELAYAGHLSKVQQ